jgi:hypothetical protein
MSELAPAQELRKAAERIRQLAGAATPGPWDAHEEHHGAFSGGITVVRSVSEPRRRIVNVDQAFHSHGEREANIAHIAYWDPTVTVLVADVFDQWARMGELDPDLLHRVGGPETLALARAILGGHS